MNIISSVAFAFLIFQLGNAEIEPKIHNEYLLLKNNIKEEISKQNKLYNKISTAILEYETQLKNLNSSFQRYVDDAIDEMQIEVANSKAKNNNCEENARNNFQKLKTDFPSFYETECTYFINFLNFGSDLKDEINYHVIDEEILDDESDLANLMIDVVLRKFETTIKECSSPEKGKFANTSDCLNDENLKTFLEHIQKVTTGAMDLHNSFMEEYNLESSSCYRALWNKGYSQVAKIKSQVSKCLSVGRVLNNYQMKILQ